MIFRVSYRLFVNILLFAAIIPSWSQTTQDGQAKEHSGYLAIGIARDTGWPSYSDQILYFRNSSSGEKQEIKLQIQSSLFHQKSPEEFSTSDCVGTIFVVPLSVGKYEIYNYRLMKAAGTTQLTWKAKEDYSIPFDIDADAVSYLGEFCLQARRGKNILGLPALDGGVWKVTDQSIRDLDIINKKLPELVGKSVINAVPKSRESVPANVAEPKN
jgi:hypothetical protein